MASSAIDKISALDNLQAVWKRFWKTSRASTYGTDGVSPEIFQQNLVRNLRLLRSQIREGYSFSPLRAIPIEKKNSSKKRLICIPTVADRLIQRILLQSIEAKAKKLGILNDVSFGFVRDTQGVRRGAHAARKAAVERRQNKPWAFKTDISGFFDNIQRGPLILDLERAFRLRSLHPLLEGVIGCEIDETDSSIKRIAEENGLERGKGLRQGMPLSPILSNFVLRDFDQAFGKRGFDLVRYADDLVVFAESQSDCKIIQDFTNEQLQHLGLKASKEKTVICHPDEAVEFLGMDLVRRKDRGGYALVISEEKFESIKHGFTQLHDWSSCQKKGLDLGQLLKRLDQVASGYRAAYSCADNFEELKEKTSVWTRGCAERVYSSLFGRDAVQKLDKNKENSSCSRRTGVEESACAGVRVRKIVFTNSDHAR